MEGTSTTPSYGIPFTLPLIGNTVHLSSVAGVLFSLAVLVTFVIAVILYYHWIRYGVGVLGTLTVMVAYAVGTSILLLAALGFLSYI